MVLFYLSCKLTPYRPSKPCSSMERLSTSFPHAIKSSKLPKRSTNPSRLRNYFASEPPPTTTAVELNDYDCNGRHQCPHNKNGGQKDPPHRPGFLTVFRVKVNGRRSDVVPRANESCAFVWSGWVGECP